MAMPDHRAVSRIGRQFLTRGRPNCTVPEPLARRRAVSLLHGRPDLKTSRTGPAVTAARSSQDGERSRAQPLAVAAAAETTGARSRYAR